MFDLEYYKSIKVKDKKYTDVECEEYRKYLKRLGFINNITKKELINQMMFYNTEDPDLELKHQKKSKKNKNMK